MFPDAAIVEQRRCGGATLVPPRRALQLVTGSEGSRRHCWWRPPTSSVRIGSRAQNGLLGLLMALLPPLHRCAMRTVARNLASTGCYAIGVCRGSCCTSHMGAASASVGQSSSPGLRRVALRISCCGATGWKAPRWKSCLLTWAARHRPSCAKANYSRREWAPCCSGACNSHEGR